MDWTLKNLSEGGVDTVVMAVNYMAEALVRYLGPTKFDLGIIYSREQRPLGTGGPIKKAQELLNGDPFLVLNGDIITDVDYRRLIEFHKAKAGLATVALTQVPDPSRYGAVGLDWEGRITRFVEKPEPGKAPSNLINAGIYVPPHDEGLVPTAATIARSRAERPGATMKITAIEVYHVRYGHKDGRYAWSGGHAVTSFLSNVVRVSTDEGIDGWGETAVLWSLYGLEAGYEKMAENVFKAYLKDQNPLNREALYNTLYTCLTAQHSDYITLGPISAFDIALWDITGKHFHTPVYNLLGGKYREKIRTYTYLFDLEAGNLLEATSDWTKNPGKLAEIAAKRVEEGFTGVKFDPLHQAMPGQLPVPPWEVTLADYDHAEKSVRLIRALQADRAGRGLGDITASDYHDHLHYSIWNLAGCAVRWGPLSSVCLFRLASLGLLRNVSE